MKKIMTLLFVLLLSFVVSDFEVSAHTTIKDGNARMDNGYSPYEVEAKSWNDRWKNRALKNTSWRDGRQLLYDVYSGNSSQSLKRSWTITNSSKWGESQPYLQFWGWSAIAGHHHHDQVNQATYILAVNNRTGEEKMYKTEMSNLNATNDLEYNRQSDDPKNIWNKCGPTEKNKGNVSDCNFAYEWVGFKAWIPLNDLFPDKSKNATWEFFIVKNVEGHVVYDELRLPFQLNELNHSNGKLNLTSGINASRLTMIGSPVIRRLAPIGNDSGSGARYFVLGNPYTRVSQDETRGTSVWYRVRDPRDNGLRWASSAYWRFGGTQARLSYETSQKKCPDGTIVNVGQNCTADVTIYHKDANSGSRLDTQKAKVTVGKSYSFTPRNRGYYKDSANNPYVASPTGQKESGTVPNNNMSFTFNYKASLPNPTEIVELDGTTEGRVEGNFIWRLTKEIQHLLSGFMN